MSVVLGIDPGKNAGWAYISTEKGLLACGIWRIREWDDAHIPVHSHPVFEADHVIVEIPQVYPRMKERPQDLIKLTFLAGRIVDRILTQRPQTKLTTVSPADWKGQLDKNIGNQRVWEKLCLEEQAIVDKAGSKIAEGLVHNMMDAVGLALHGVGRGIRR